MVTIAHVTEKIMERKPFLQECLARGLINVFALAEHISPEVEIELKKKVKVTAIMMALRRLSEKLSINISTFKKNKNDFDLTIQSDIIETTYDNNQSVNTNDYKIKKNDFFAMTQGLHETTILSNARNEKMLIEKIEKSPLTIIRNLSAMIIRLPKENQNMPGLYYLFVREFAWHKITIIELVSTLNELIIILKDEDIPQSYRLIKDLIENMP